ncbi:MAG: hypothetical protein LBQ18_03545 [Campylobacteraceae bacterium]|jgi:hypothetical protein|nr:hypothetical protein [Campylobacteraceae bacterium]
MQKNRIVFTLLVAIFLAGCQTGDNIASVNYAYVDIFLTDVADKNITIVFTNERDTDVSLPPVIVDTTLKNEVYPPEEHVDTFNYIPNEIRNFEPPELIEQSGDFDPSQQSLYKEWLVGDRYNWNVHSDFAAGGGTSRAATLEKQLTVWGRTINIWVEDGEFESGKIDAAELEYIASYVGNIYASVVDIAKEPWGTHSASNLIPSDQPLDIVLMNFNKDTRPYGTIGYFWSRDNYRKSTYKDSNEAVVILVDTETYYLGTKQYVLSTIAHELTHAINFYQRYVLMGSEHQFATFLNEMTAVMMEDVVAKQISHNSVSSEYTNWLRAPLYHCDFAKWGACGDSYSVAGSFGAFLLRQYGIDFYKALLGMGGSSLDVLHKALSPYNNEGLGLALRNWGASIAMFPSSDAPEGFGYPARSDNGVELEAFDGNVYKQYRNLPDSSPSVLEAHAHFPFLRRTTDYIYEETFLVPEGVSVSVVVQ